MLAAARLAADLFTVAADLLAAAAPAADLLTAADLLAAAPIGIQPNFPDSWPFWRST